MHINCVCILSDNDDSDVGSFRMSLMCDSKNKYKLLTAVITLYACWCVVIVQLVTIHDVYLFSNVEEV